MNQDDIQYSIELLEEAISNQDWEPVIETKDFLQDFLNRKHIKPKYVDSDDEDE